MKKKIKILLLKKGGNYVKTKTDEQTNKFRLTENKFLSQF